MECTKCVNVNYSMVLHVDLGVHHHSEVDQDERLLQNREWAREKQEIDLHQLMVCPIVRKVIYHILPSSASSPGLFLKSSRSAINV